MVGVGVAVIAVLLTVQQSTNGRLDAIDQRLGGMDARLTGMEARLAEMDKGLASLGERVKGVETRLDLQLPMQPRAAKP